MQGLYYNDLPPPFFGMNIATLLLFVVYASVAEVVIGAGLAERIDDHLCSLRSGNWCRARLRSAAIFRPWAGA